MYSHVSGWDLTISAKIFPPRMLLWLRGGPIGGINVEKPSTLARRVVPGIYGTFVCLPPRCSYFQLQKRPLSFKNCGTLSVRMYTVCASFRFFPVRSIGGIPRWPAFRYTQKKGSFCQGTLENFFCFLAIRRKRGRFGAPHKQKNKPLRRKICETTSIGLIFSRFRDILRKTFRVSWEV